MKNILLAGAGRSASVLIDYLLENASKEDWQITIADINAGQVVQNERRLSFDVNNSDQRASEVKRADLVISLLPPFLHALIADACIVYKKHLLTASYVSPEIARLDAAAQEAGVLFLNEMGLDPGIDHMSAMAILEDIKDRGGAVLSFKSYTGGLIAPESCNNPWSYKLTWNPRNVILAGQATARYLCDKQIRHVPYSRIFNTVWIRSPPYCVVRCVRQAFARPGMYLFSWV
jgi:saccharopine dehydrogenase-like NADP-dependent oxidoreductase